MMLPQNASGLEHGICRHGKGCDKGERKDEELHCGWRLTRKRAERIEDGEIWMVRMMDAPLDFLNTDICSLETRRRRVSFTKEGRLSAEKMLQENLRLIKAEGLSQKLWLRLQFEEQKCSDGLSYRSSEEALRPEVQAGLQEVPRLLRWTNVEVRYGR